MTYERLKAVLEEKPFKQFSIHTSDGDVVRVKSPEYAWLHPSKRVILVATDARLDTEEVIDLLHVTKLSGSAVEGHRKGGNGRSK
jgi:hypothetical protein